ncbi:MAG TPA: hypothetical protein VIM73_19385 [Polyangiaceae bacterium]
MTRSRIVRALMTAALGFSALTASACSNHPQESREQGRTGSLNLPLTATVNGHSYRFSRFQLYISPEWLWLTSTGAESSLSTQLTTGYHQATLYDWSLERADASGAYHPVEAALLSSSSIPFEILNGSTTTISFQFETDGQIVTIGSGAVHVLGEVRERAPTCLPLGDDCGEGAWCPPPELTGAPVACRAAGSLALGERCDGPAQCSANSSCIDLGAGAVCAALCSGAEFGAECPSGGICTSEGVDYGVCRPASEP